MTRNRLFLRGSRWAHGLWSIAAMAGILALAGCGGGAAAKVTGRVTCQGKAVVGGIQFSPKDEGNTGPTVTAELKEDGSYEVRLKTIGKYTIIVTPRDVKYPVPKGEFDYPCDRSPLERQIKAGDNTLTIELPSRSK